jgi:hypothetical protein
MTEDDLPFVEGHSTATPEAQAWLDSHSPALVLKLWVIKRTDDVTGVVGLTDWEKKYQELGGDVVEMAAVLDQALLLLATQRAAIHRLMQAFDDKRGN